MLPTSPVPALEQLRARHDFGLGNSSAVCHLCHERRGFALARVSAEVAARGPPARATRSSIGGRVAGRSGLIRSAQVKSTQRSSSRDPARAPPRPAVSIDVDPRFARPKGNRNRTTRLRLHAGAGEHVAEIAQSVTAARRLARSRAWPSEQIRGTSTRRSARSRRVVDVRLLHHPRRGGAHFELPATAPRATAAQLSGRPRRCPTRFRD